jgi:hypothetical protein
MQTDKFEAMKKQKQAEWGDKPCDHPSIVQEHYLGSGTGDYACRICGRDIAFDGNRKPKPN